MIRLEAAFRSAGIGAVCTLTLSCALVAAADTESGKSKSTSSTVPKKTTSTSSHTHRSTSSGTSTDVKKSSAKARKSSGKSAGKRSSHRKPPRVRGQEKIDSERATAIQQALIREHYLTGEPAGTWDEASEEAMRRYQADHGWQNKTVPDSRALISLGLGPSKDHLLNPESAMTTAPDPKSQNAPATPPASPPAARPMTPATSAPAATSPPSTNDTSSPQ